MVLHYWCTLGFSFFFPIPLHLSYNTFYELLTEINLDGWMDGWIQFVAMCDYWHENRDPLNLGEMPPSSPATSMDAVMNSVRRTA